jgi:RNA polymerase sigma-70 factor (ECF subfamily)
MTSIDFKKMVQKEAKPLRHYAYQLTRNVEDTNDLVQETMLKAYTYQDKFENGTNLKGWLYTIMKNTFINNYRRMVKRNTFIDQTDNDFYLDSVAPLVKNEGEQGFLRRDIDAAIGELPRNLQKPFTDFINKEENQAIKNTINYKLELIEKKRNLNLSRKEESKFDLRNVSKDNVGNDSISSDVAQ